MVRHFIAQAGPAEAHSHDAIHGAENSLGSFVSRLPTATPTQRAIRPAKALVALAILVSPVLGHADAAFHALLDRPRGHRVLKRR